MSEKKELTNEELEKVSGGFHPVADPLLNTTIQLKVCDGLYGTINVSAYVLAVAELDGKVAGRRYYELNIDNGYAIGWYDQGRVTGGMAFSNREHLKTAAHDLQYLFDRE